jgi:hypothetical protein
MARDITVGMFIDAIERDGLPKTTGTLFRTRKGGRSIYHPDLSKYSTTKIGAACAVGQACINLGITDPKTNYLSDINSKVADILNFIIDTNDDTALSLKVIAQRARRKYANYLDLVIDKRFYDDFDYTPYLNMAVYKPKVILDAPAS